MKRYQTTTDWPVHARIDGPIVMIGFGSIGKGTLPLIERHIGFDRQDTIRRDRSPMTRIGELLDDARLRFIHQAMTRTITASC